VAEKEIQNATVLAILPAREDRLSLSVAFADSGWILVFTGNLREALVVLQSILVGVVLCDIRFPCGHTWKDLISQMLRMEDPPLLILADRLADDCLWVEALNLGA
jgi:DNA-binding NtrC family response regulator